mmetsp:Transcript_32049/g.70062  ORF Transcript_32049/g.70062 Transcript_32049/m.70062 type:complete len:634 (-) Transcript_32049:220-2121(-)
MQGFRRPQQSWIADLHCKYFSSQASIKMPEFLELLSRYGERHRQEMGRQFLHATAKSSGRLGVAELKMLLRYGDISPLPGMVRELVDELTGSSAGLASLSFEQFLRAHDLFHDRMGFCRAELDQLQFVFTRFGGDQAGLDASGVSQALAWLGFPVDSKVAEALVAEHAEAEAPGRVSDGRYLELMRKYHQHEVERIKTGLANRDADFSGTINCVALPELLVELGYVMATPRVVREAFNALTRSQGRRRSGSECIAPGDRQLLNEDVYLLVNHIRQMDGFLQADLEEIQAAFVKEVGTQFLPKLDLIACEAALRWLGYPVSLWQLQQPFEDLDLSCSGTLDAMEFRKLVAHVRTTEARVLYCEIIAAAESVVAMSQSLFRPPECLASWGSLDEAQLRAAFLSLGYHLDKEDGDVAEAGSRGLALWEAVEFLRDCRLRSRDVLRASNGFGQAEVRRMRQNFRRHDSKGTGVVSRRRLANSIVEAWPDSRTSRIANAEAAAIREEADEDHDQEINFPGFLRMMRMWRSRVSRRRLQREQEAVQATEFSSAEVKEFRLIYNKFDVDYSRSVRLKELEKMLAGILPGRATAGANTEEQLKRLFVKVDLDRDHAIDFGEFLFAMRRLLQAEDKDGSPSP